MKTPKNEESNTSSENAVNNSEESNKNSKKMKTPNLTKSMKKRRKKTPKNEESNISSEYAVNNSEESHKISTKIKATNIIKNRKKQPKETPKKEESIISSEYAENYTEGSNKKNSNYINNMIILKSGNIAVSMKEAIEIYNLRQLNFSGANCFYNNDLIQNNCLLQRINLIRNRKISYVFQLLDETLLCSTYAKIFRIKLTNNDLNYEIMSCLYLGASELPTKIISLGNSFLVILTEQKINCNIKIYRKIDNIESDSNNLAENKVNEKSEEINKSKSKNEKNPSINNNCRDVPPIGNCDFNKNKEINEDTSFELINKNINEPRKLWVSIHPIERKYNNNINDEEENYFHEFVATSNATYDLGKDTVAFFGIKKDRKGDYIIKIIKEIDELSCSAEADSICQINENYLCIGLQNHNLKGQISGFAFIDLNKRDIIRIVRDEEISCVCYNDKNNLLFASMEVRDPKRNYFSTKIYNVIQNKGDKGNEEIELKEIYKYRNNHTDTISSIQQMTGSYFKDNLEEQNILGNIIFATSSKDSTLEVVKAEI